MNEKVVDSNLNRDNVILGLEIQGSKYDSHSEINSQIFQWIDWKILHSYYRNNFLIRMVFRASKLFDFSSHHIELQHRNVACNCDISLLNLQTSSRSSCTQQEGSWIRHTIHIQTIIVRYHSADIINRVSLLRNARDEDEQQQQQERRQPTASYHW